MLTQYSLHQPNYLMRCSRIAARTTAGLIHHFGERAGSVIALGFGGAEKEIAAPQLCLGQRLVAQYAGLRQLCSALAYRSPFDDQRVVEIDSVAGRRPALGLALEDKALANHHIGGGEAAGVSAPACPARWRITRMAALSAAALHYRGMVSVNGAVRASKNSSQARIPGSSLCRCR
ncbi:MAG: hypothetical protein U0074_08565 [Kouleothrix sp.]